MLDELSCGMLGGMAQERVKFVDDLAATCLTSRTVVESLSNPSDQIVG